jgi:hypothetical protein
VANVRGYSSLKEVGKSIGFDEPWHCKDANPRFVIENLKITIERLSTLYGRSSVSHKQVFPIETCYIWLKLLALLVDTSYVRASQSLIEQSTA